MNDVTPTNPLDDMETETQENGSESQTDAQFSGGASEGNGAADTTQTDVQETEQQDEETAAPTPPAVDEEISPEPPAPPQHVGGRIAAARSGEDHGIIYGRRKAEIAEILKKQPKVAFMVPRAEGEVDGLAYETVQINGHRMEIRKGVMVQIPQQVAEILANKYRVQMEAGSSKLINRSEEVTDRLS